MAADVGVRDSRVRSRPDVGDPPREHVRAALERGITGSLTAISVVGAVAFFVFALLNVYTSPPEEMLRWVAVDVLAGLAFLAFAAFHRWRPVRSRGHAAIFGLLMVALGNVLHGLWFGGDADSVILVMILILAPGALMVSWPWYGAAVGTVLAAWGLATTNWELRGLDASHALVFPLAALTLSTMMHAQRCTSQRRMEVLRWRDAQMSAELSDALSAVRQSEERFRALVQNSSDVITILAPDGTAIYESPSIERVLGYKPEEVIGANALSLVHPDDVARAESVIVAALSEPGMARVTEVRFRRKDGQWAHIESTVYAALDQPGIEGVVINTRDISERKAAEEAMRRSDKLAALGTLVAGVAHEINNPLQFMMGNVELAQMTVTDLRANPDLGADERTALSAIEKNHATILAGTQRIARITDGLRYVARSSSSGARRHESLAEIAEGVLAVTSPRLNDDIRVVTDFGAERDVRVNADEIAQVLLNLVLNAVDAMEASPERVLTIRTRDEADRVVLEVTDTGCGIPEDLTPHVFTPFHTTKHDGTGLGLSICHGIVTSHGGGMTFTSAPGNTTFRLALPAAQTPSGTPRAAAAAERRRGRPARP